MDMKKTFVGLGIGVLVVTGLIQSGVIDVNDVDLVNRTDGTPHPSSMAEKESLFDTSEPIEKVFQLKSLEGGKLCGLPEGKHKITAQQTQLTVINSAIGKEETIESILGGSGVLNITDLPYQETNGYHWGILFNNKRSGSQVNIDSSGCVKVTLNVGSVQKKATTLVKQVDIPVSIQ